MPQKPKVALLPLDERPVNTGLVKEVAEIAGFRCVLPPAGMLPDFRVGGDTSELGQWLQEQAASCVALVVSLDTLVYGGLIAARTSLDFVEECVSRLQVLRTIHERYPELPIFAVSLVTRASDSNDSVEEPEYWTTYGRALHGLGADAHRAWLGESEAPTPEVEGAVWEDFAARRLRNHVVNLAALQMRWEGVLDYLALTADDTAERSAGSAEQQWFEYWRMLGADTQPVVGYPGADETGAVLMARALSVCSSFSPRVQVATGNPASLDLVPPYENGPIKDSIVRQVEAGGGQVVSESPDMVLVVHGPDPERGDQGSVQPPYSDPEEVARTVAAVQGALELGVPVALADVRFANGADLPLLDALADAGLLEELAAYGGWNTAGNALGGAVATGLAVTIGLVRGTLDKKAQRRALIRRLLDEGAYQALIRRDLMPTVFEGSYKPVSPKQLETAAERTLRGMEKQLEKWGITEEPKPASVRFPWSRSFEVDIDLG